MDLEKYSEFDDHQLVSWFYDKKTNLKGLVAIHRNKRKLPSFGATRLNVYKNIDFAVKDVLRLSRSMSYKSSLAGLKYGGAKAVILANGKINNRKDFFKSYARVVNKLGGSFVTGCDVGVSNEDVKTMRRYSKFIVGTKADPVRFTAYGVVKAMEVCLKEVFGSSDFESRTVAIQGVGKTGGTLLENLYKKTKQIYVADINKEKLINIKQKYPKIKLVKTSEITGLDVDVLAPCAMQHAIGYNNVDTIKAKLVCGSANNQLETDEIDDKLYKKGILYAPDYLVNAGGLISVVDEYENGEYRVKRVQRRVDKIKLNMKKVIEVSKKKRVPMGEVADLLAYETEILN